MVFLDTSAQPMILGVQFAIKMGMLDSKLRKSMWQIRIASGNIEEVLGESSDFIALCHAHTHGLIHDGQLWACPSWLLGLMYVCRVNVCF